MRFKENQSNGFAMIELRETRRVRFLELKFITAFRGFEIGFQTRWLCRTRWRRRRHNTVSWIHHRINTIITTKITISLSLTSLGFSKLSTMAFDAFSRCRSKSKWGRKNEITIYIVVGMKRNCYWENGYLSQRNRRLRFLIGN